MQKWIAIIIELASVLSAMQLNGTMQVTHEKNLIWAQKDESTGTARIVGVNGDPEQWIPIRVASSRYITAPGSTWKFQALTFDYRKQLLFWSESGNKKIQGIYLNGSISPFDVYSGTSSSVLGLACDWVRGNLYWTDMMYNWIVITTYKTEDKNDLQRVIVDKGLDQPADIVVHPLKRKLFWSDIGVVPKIETSNLIGQDRKIFVFTELNQPTGLTLDLVTDTLYWVDKNFKRIEAISIDGTNRRVIVQSQDHNYHGVALYQDYLFATEQSQKQLLVYSRSSGKREVSFSMDGALPYDVIMYDISKQPPSEGSCRDDSCDHICTEDDMGDPVCLCAHGYILLHDGRTCSVKSHLEAPQIIYTIGAAICSFPENIPHVNLDTLSLDKYCFLTGQYTTSLAFNVQKQIIYLYDNDTQSISSLKIKGDNKKSYSPKILIEDTGMVKSMSYDWISLNFYWIHSAQGKIVSSSKDGSYRVDVVKGLAEPTSLVVNAVNRKIYWALKGGHPKIQVSDLDGDNIKNLVTTELVWPDHLTLDYVSYRLYWCDKKFGRIEWASFDGKIRHQILEQPKSSIQGLTIFQDFILWTEDGIGNGLHIGFKETGEKIRGIVHPEVGKAGSVITYDKSSQPAGKGNPCNVTPLCEHMCFPKSEKSRTCRCTLGYVLHQNGYSCTTDPFPDNFLLFSDTYKRQIFQMNLDTQEVHAVPLTNIGNPLAVTLDPVQQRVYWTDVDFKLLKSAKIDGTDENLVGMLSKDAIPDGIAVDPVTSQLYYTDGGNKVIGVFHTIAKTYLTLLNRRLSKPRAIALCPELGLMFWTDWGKQSRIERASMDGSNRRLLVHTGRGAWPNGISIDKDAKKIYWCDAKRETIEYCDMNGQNRRILMKLSNSHMFGLSVLGADVYYTDWKKRTIMKLSTDTTQSNTTPMGPEEFSRANGIVAYSRSRSHSMKSHVCLQSSRAQCSDFCLPTPRKKVCRCPDGVKMSPDKHTCVTAKGFNSAKKTEMWLTNAAPLIIPTRVANQDESWKRFTTNPSLLTSSLYNRETSSYEESIHKSHSFPDGEQNSGTRKGNMSKTPLEGNENLDEDNINDNKKSNENMSDISISTTLPNLSDEEIESTLRESDINPLYQGEINGNNDEITEENTHLDSNEEMYDDNKFVDRTEEVLVGKNGIKGNSFNLTSSSLVRSEDKYIKNLVDSRNLIVEDYGSNLTDYSDFEDDQVQSTQNLDRISSLHPLNPNNNNDNINVTEFVNDKNNTKNIVLTTELTDKHILNENYFNKDISVNTSVEIEKTNSTKLNIDKKSNFTTKSGITRFLNVSLKFGTTTVSVGVDNDEMKNGNNETQVLQDTVNSHVIGFLIIICSAVVVMCVLVVCAVFIYNKLIKKPKMIPPRNNNNINSNQTIITTNFDQNKLTSHLPVTRPMNNYHPNINGQIATIRNNKGNNKRQHPPKNKVTKIKNIEDFSSEVVRKYANMNDSHFTGHHEDIASNMEPSPDYDTDCCSDFSFDTDLESTASPDFVTFRHNDVSKA